MATVLGVDAYKNGWVAVELIDGRFSRAVAVATLATLPTADVVAVDIPLGLVEQGWRPVDDEARRFVGKRWASVFRVAPKQAWGAETLAQANVVCAMRTGGQKMSAQGWGLRRKLLEANSAEYESLLEAHPEVSFCAMNQGELPFAKTTYAGQRQRESLLRRHGIVLPDQFEGSANSVPVIDVLDAAAVAWTAHRVVTSRARRLPEGAAERPMITY